MGKRSGIPQLVSISDNVVLIPLTKGQFAAVDTEDSTLVKSNFWYLTSDGRYAAARIDNEIVLMHRLILSPGKEEECDHIDGDGLNNRRSNLRVVSHIENTWNTDRHKFRLGISIDNTHNRWKVYIDEAGQKRINIGTVKSLQEAELLLARAKNLQKEVNDFEEFRNACIALKPNRSNARTRLCHIEGCTALVISRGMCNRHYQNWYANRVNTSPTMPRSEDVGI